jgi:hypothetical protein
MKKRKGVYVSVWEFVFKPDKMERNIMDKKRKRFSKILSKIMIILTRFPING